jgi:hypothetical protein
VTTPTSPLRATVALLGEIALPLPSMDDAALLEAQALVGQLSHLAARHAAALAGEVARRSTPHLGHDGLAQTTGHRTPEALIQALTGITAPEAARLVAVGSLPDSSPLSVGVTAGEISVTSADAIRRGLGRPDAGTSAESLDDLAANLVSRSPGFTPEQLYRAAADARNRIDAEGVARREREQREARFFRARQRDDGMVGGSFLLDQEDGALLISALDAVLSPRRGGPRFVDERSRGSADALQNDPRTNDQLAADTFADIVRLAVNADAGRVFGTRQPAVHVVVTADDLTSGLGYAHLEGAPEAVSIDTTRRLACSAGLIGLLFHRDGRPLDVGRSQRLFTERQRIALAARDGGCRFPGCTRPPSYCEAHHIDHWMRDRGSTDVDRGILLCKHHHLLIHNNQWQIVHDPDGGFAVVPPPSVDPKQMPRPMPSRSRVMERLRVGA